MKSLISPKISLERLRHVAAQQFDIRIASDGRWFHEGDEIRRFELVKLFASILVLDDDGEYWLATPAEKGRITVDDAPFIVRDMTVKAGVRSQQNEICFQTNIDEMVLLDIKHPLQLRAAKQSPDLRPYIEVRDGLLAKLSRPVYYQLADYAEVGTDGRLGVWSHNHFFALEA
ncbi:DUF1285 domain-containing protein [Alphaproteobacteria bacterium]|nr:DUF1285 domain-containing protein [Alphaproteobacteria bacterium]